MKSPQARRSPAGLGSELFSLHWFSIFHSLFFSFFVPFFIFQPFFQRNEPVVNGEIVVYRLNEREIPIVHRVIKRHENSETGEIKYLTKGDNNQVDDRGLYAPGQRWITPKDIIGRARAQCPYIGMVTIVLNDNPKIKYACLALLGGFMLLKREE